jgi:hypothetical protein
MASPGIREFDALALFDALEDKRQAEGLSWQGAADAIWALSSELNRVRDARGLANHPISPSTLTNIAKRGNTSCQHALFFLRWLERTPESFLAGGSPQDGARLPDCGPDRRPRWDLKSLQAAVSEARGERQLTWAAAGAEIGGKPGQLTGLKQASFATNMALAMRITQWLERPAADFVVPARW